MALADERAREEMPLGDGKLGVSKEVQEMLLELPKEEGWSWGHPDNYLYKYQGTWTRSERIETIISIQMNFIALDTDLMLCSLPKSGTTWLKALMFAIVSRNHYTLPKNHLLNTNPHYLVPSLEHKIKPNNIHQQPRLYATHIPYASLPESCKSSKCKIVYVSRNPLDNFISLWHFLNNIKSTNQQPLEIENALDKFCRGISPMGPFWDHVSGYWKASLDNPHKVLFLKYEDIKKDTISQVKRLAEFARCPFSVEEESDGVMEEIIRLCSFDNMKNLEPNKTGHVLHFETSTFFRKAMVGDWKNYLTPSMAARLHKVVEDNLKDSGLSFKVY